MGSRVIVSSLPNHGVDNLGMENDSDGHMEEKKFTRSSTTLSQVDLDILSRQNMEGEENKVIIFA